ncbi:MAG: cytidylyltransferase domain-containing protein [Acidobacteriota bacterium]
MTKRRDLGNVIAHLPARGGSKRVPSKNLRYLAGQPMLAYALRTALECADFSAVYVNTESDSIAALARELGALIYRRKTNLASDAATSDQFNFDIIDALNPDTLVMINPVCPLLRPDDIEGALEAYRRRDADTLISTSATRLQCFYRDQPVNIDLNAQLAATQHNEPVHVCNWAITIWDAHRFRDRYNRRGFAVFGQRRILHSIPPLRGLKISTEADFRMADLILRALRDETGGPTGVQYWSQLH